MEQAAEEFLQHMMKSPGTKQQLVNNAPTHSWYIKWWSYENGAFICETLPESSPIFISETYPDMEAALQQLKSDMKDVMYAS